MKKFLYYFINLTWGLLHNLIGFILFIIFIIFKSKPFMFGPNIVVPFKIKTYSAFSLGIFIFSDERIVKNYYLLAHEFGHSLQGIVLGPFWFFIVAIPSVVRFYYRELWLALRNKGKFVGKSLPDYDAIWFEGTATKYGEKYSSKEWLKF